MGFTLTADQLQAKETITNAYHDGTKAMMLCGFAGTGKTVSSLELLKDLNLYKVAFTAPTNQAVGVLRNALSSQVFNAEFETIYSLLNLRVTENHDTGEKTVYEAQTKGNWRDKIAYYDLVVIDEGSPLDDKIMGYIDKKLIQNNIPVLFMGDSAQLPPVKNGDKLSSCFNYKLYELTEVMRYHGDIAHQVKNLRDNLEDGVLLQQASDQTLNLLTPGLEGEWFNQVIDTFKNSENPQDVKVLSYTNRAVNTLNLLIREGIYGKDESRELVLPGEILVAKEPVVDPLDDGIVLSTSQNLVADEIEHRDSVICLTHLERFKNLRPILFNQGLTFEEKIDTYYVKNSSVYRPGAYLPFQFMTSFDPKLEMILSALKEAALSYDIKTDKQSRNKLFVEHFKLRKRYHELVHGYALTIHKSQGSTYSKAFVNTKDIRSAKCSNFIKNRLLYVVLTRAKEAVYCNSR